MGRVMCYDWTLTTLALTRLPLLFPPTPGHHINHCPLHLKKKHQNRQKLSGGSPADFMCFDWRPWAGSFRHLLGRGHPLNPLPGRVRSGCTAQCVHCTVFFPLDRARWDLSSNLKSVMLLNIYLSQRIRSKGTLRKVDFREPQTLNL